jgi:NADH-quinone oxidoreductase subunit G
LTGFAHTSSEDVWVELFGAKPEFVARLDNALSGIALNLSSASAGLERIADVPIHFADAIARRAPSLQRSRDAAAPTARLNSATLAKLALQAGDAVVVRQGDGHARLVAEVDAGVPANCVRVAAAHPSTVALGAMFGTITVERG